MIGSCGALSKMMFMPFSFLPFTPRTVSTTPDDVNRWYRPLAFQIEPSRAQPPAVHGIDRVPAEAAWPPVNSVKDTQHSTAQPVPIHQRSNVHARLVERLRSEDHIAHTARRAQFSHAHVELAAAQLLWQALVRDRQDEHRITCHRCTPRSQ